MKSQYAITKTGLWAIGIVFALLLILMAYLWIGVNHNKASIQYICNQTVNYSPIIGTNLRDDESQGFCK